ncbi:hypothetical protein KY284_001097 [Solanum tuberosum]|nr:hypothetical protein KY284_001097 [Solanum tuberosum]
MAEMYKDWISGQAPPSSNRGYLNTNMSPPIQVSTNDPIYPPGFGPYANTFNVAGTSMVRPLITPMTSNPLFVLIVPTNSIPQPTMVPKSNNDPSSQVLHYHGYTPKEALKIPSSYPHTHQYSSPVEAEKVVKNEEDEEITRKIKSLIQSIKIFKDWEVRKVSHSVICACFPTFIYPSVSKLQNSRNMMDMGIM